MDYLKALIKLLQGMPEYKIKRIYYLALGMIEKD